ncbi:MAG: MBL fold metallo-hydrolase [Deltaproteobacteria bacterium]|nr:MBL fold metallo-hydrolase [Deltaproteobacteria bacterium]
MKISVLGCGNSTGVPVPACDCQVCLSKDSKNQRLRPSIYVEVPSEPSEEGNVSAVGKISEKIAILIDTGADLRQQVLRAQIKKLDAVFYTHVHADHVHGIDDLRGFCFTRKEPLDAYASDGSILQLRETFRYIFEKNSSYVGGCPPRLNFTPLVPFETVAISSVQILPLPLLHGNLEILGFRIGKFAYLTDCSKIPQRTFEFLEKLEVLIIDGLRYRPHATHFSLSEAVSEIEKIKPRRSYLTHLSHDVDYSYGNAILRNMSKLDIELAYDGLTINL